MAAPPATAVASKGEVVKESDSDSDSDEKVKRGEKKQNPNTKKKKKALGWTEWLRGWSYVICEMLFQMIIASHFANPMPLPPINDLTFIVTGSTSGIGWEIARQLAEIGGRV